MLGEVSEMLDILRSDADTRPPDILAASSVVINDIIREYITQPPVFVRNLSLDDYFGDKVTGALAIKIVRDAWRIDKKRFVINKKLDEVRYNAGQNYDAARIIKELPEDLEPRQSREWVCMNLAQAKVLFGINFKKGLF
jgi:hypothetical protein